MHLNIANHGNHANPGAPQHLFDRHRKEGRSSENEAPSETLYEGPGLLRSKMLSLVTSQMVERRGTQRDGHKPVEQGHPISIEVVSAFQVKVCTQNGRVKGEADTELVPSYNIKSLNRAL